MGSAMDGRTMRADDLGRGIPEWAVGSTAVCVDEGDDASGEYGYECWRLHRHGDVIGWAYDMGAGYIWGHTEPSPLTASERGIEVR